MLPNEKQSFICFLLVLLHCSGERRRRAGIPSQVRNPCQGLQLTSDGRRLPRGARLNTLSPGCRTTKTHAEQRHFHHVSHSSWLTGTAKLSLIPPLCTHTSPAAAVCLPARDGWRAEWLQHQEEPWPPRPPTAEQPSHGRNRVSPHAQVTPAQGWRGEQSCKRRCSKKRLVQAVGAASPTEQGHGVLHPSYQSGFTDLLGVNTQQL